MRYGRTLKVATAVLATATVVGCSSTSPTTVSSTPDGRTGASSTAASSTATGRAGPATYLVVDDNGVLLLTWTQDDSGNLAGSAQLAQAATGGNGPPVTSQTFSLTGRQAGSGVSLTVGAGLGSKQTWTGTVNGGTLDLQLPQSDGHLAAATLRPSNPAAYNAAVTDLSDRVTEGRAQAQAAKQQAEQQATDDRNVQALTDALAQLDSSRAALNKVPDLAPRVKAVERAVTAQRQSLAKVQAASCSARSDLVVKVGDDRVAVGDATAALADTTTVLDDAADDVAQDVQAVKVAADAVTPGQSNPLPTGVVSRVASAKKRAAQAAADGDRLGRVADDLLNRANALLSC